MNRRKALKQLGLLTGGLVLIPSCDLSTDNVIRVMNKFEITENQDQLMKSLVQSILPESELPGAISLKVDEFVWVMVDDCLDPEAQKFFLRGLSKFNKEFKSVSGTNFSTADQKEKIEGLALLSSYDPNLNSDSDSGKDKESKSKEEVKEFIGITKRYVVLGYMNSDFIMKELMPYTLIPGKYPECKLIDPSEKININA